MTDKRTVHAALALFDVVADEMKRLAAPGAEYVAENYAVLQPVWDIVKSQFIYGENDHALDNSRVTAWSNTEHYERIVALLIADKKS